MELLPFVACRSASICHSFYSEGNLEVGRSNITQMGIFVYIIVATLERGAALFMAPFWLSHPDFLLDNTYGHGEEISKKYKEGRRVC